jgi:hypothetical protein
MERMNDQSWIALLTGGMLVSTAALWFRCRHLPSMRPWLARHIIGNIILAVGACSTLFFNPPLLVYAVIAAAVFAMWIWGNKKLRAAQRRG